MIHHFYQYAVACYSWGAVLCTSSNPIGAFWKDSLCCGCIRKKPWDADIEGDNCCFLNTGTAKDSIKLENTEVLYCSFHDKVFQTPFFVALDHAEKAIVVAIRGTMSRVDVVTDINVRPESLGRFGYPESYRVHKGMFLNAMKVHEKLEELQIIPKLLHSHPDYKIVTTGTSLGSASATLLCMVLRQEYPNKDVKCFAYSPSGALMNLETARFCESFVTSVIYGDDFVARLAVKSIERLKYDVVSILRECRTPKYQILLGGLFCLCGGRPKVTFSPDMDSIRRESRQELISAYGFDFAEINVVPMKGERCPFYLNSEQELMMQNPKCNRKASRALTPDTTPPPPPHKLLPFELMYPPGKILHITETSSFRSGRRPKNDSKPRWNIRWADRQEFREIIITSRMIMDHVPFRPNKALQDLTRRWRQSPDNENNAQISDPVIISDIISNSKSCHSLNTSISSPVPIVDDLVLSQIPSNKPSKHATS
ncbi:Sn1-specific diacylglycerol lipase beta [Orchesella cincta]|uniref:sn-1-specific diacylglycerol lipase n=1 Tax=Orchesella cincta TaxID=48709 RepID=A0A1D2MVG4_ORCCI|nr:Sn1-specific diacylglycerol lipase beta [Orchesella cincta]